MNILKMVKSLKEKLGTSDPFIICKILNIEITYSDLDDTKGVCEEVFGKKSIIINSQLSQAAHTFVLAHELGHALLHNAAALGTPLRYIYEMEADLFATCLLYNSVHLVGGDLILELLNFGEDNETMRGEMEDYIEYLFTENKKDPLKVFKEIISLIQKLKAYRDSFTSFGKEYKEIWNGTAKELNADLGIVLRKFDKIIKKN